MRKPIRAAVVSALVLGSQPAAYCQPGAASSNTARPDGTLVNPGDAAPMHTGGPAYYNVPGPQRLSEMTESRGWGAEHPRLAGDLDGSGRLALVGFGDDGVWVARFSNGWTAHFALADFGYNNGWRVGRHVRAVADINGDGRQDIVGFGDAGVYRSLSTPGGFGPVKLASSDFGHANGWRPDKHERLLGDVDGDGIADIVAFGDDGVWLALGTPSGHFGRPVLAIHNFGFNQGWNSQDHVRTLADVNGDGREDIVAFGRDGVWTALGQAGGLGGANFRLMQFGYVQGWRAANHVRLLGDVNGDRCADIVGFGEAGVWTALADCAGGFHEARFIIPAYGHSQGLTRRNSSRLLADVDNDGRMDIVVVSQAGIAWGLSTNAGVERPQQMLRALSMEHVDGTSRVLVGRFVAATSGMDIVAFAPDNGVLYPVAFGVPPLLPQPTDPVLVSKTHNTVRVTLPSPQGTFVQGVKAVYEAGTGLQTTAVDPDGGNFSIGGLQPATHYCFSAVFVGRYADSVESPGLCLDTDAPPPPQPQQEIHTASVFLSAVPITSGFQPFVGSWGPVTNAHITRISYPNDPTRSRTLRFLLPGHSTTECGRSDVTVDVEDGHSLEEADVKRIFGNVSGVRYDFVACYASQTGIDGGSTQIINIEWRRPL